MYDVILFPFLRVRSRATVIQFKEPAIAPCNDNEEDTFTEFEELISSGKMSTMVGWAISLGKAVSSTAGKKEVVEIKEMLRGTYNGRNLQNWSLLLFFLKKVGL